MKQEAEWVILCGHRRIGLEVQKVPKAKGGGQSGKNGFTPKGKSNGRGALGIPGTPRP